MPDNITPDRVVKFDAGLGNAIEIELYFDGERESTQIDIDGVPYHFERIHKSLLGTLYILDRDPDYHPYSDKEGYCYIISPFMKSGRSQVQ